MSQNEVARKRFGKVDLVLSVYTETTGHKFFLADWCGAGFSLARANGFPCDKQIEPHNESLFGEFEAVNPINFMVYDLPKEYRFLNYDSVKNLVGTLTANLFSVGDTVLEGEEKGTVISIDGTRVMVRWESGDEWDVCGRKLLKV